MFAQAIANKLHIKQQQAETVLKLLSEGSTVPFIARYRKDMTGALDEVMIQQILDEEKRMKEMAERKASIEKSITEQGKMTDVLQQQLDAAENLSQLEDIYLPYKPKRKTRADAAREQGLQPLADILLLQGQQVPEKEAMAFINDKVLTAEDALQGARDIIAETVNENTVVREKMRKLFGERAVINAAVQEDKALEAVKYKDYFDYAEPVATIPSHRILAILRGFLEGYLRISIQPEEQLALELIEELYVKGMNPSSPHVRKAIRDAYKRLLQPSLETEFRQTLKASADEEAIQVFAENLRQLLLSSPLGNKRVLAIDPGYRTGCKVVCLDQKGELLATSLIFVHEKNRQEEASNKVRSLIHTYQPEAFAIGDGTAGRETEQFIRSLSTGLPVFLVNEDGASIYSASEVARREFPDQDITVRGAISIGRRLMDPLSELVKIDPKSIGVGQYQHDVNQSRLKERLDQTVMSCVNSVGVNVNMASPELLSYVSGISRSLADQIVRYRSEKGTFSRREELKQVPRLGDKAFEQCAGFLRIPDGINPLDASAVHPESYGLVNRMAEKLGVPVGQLIANETLLKGIRPADFVDSTTGQHTVNDIILELKKPGLDPRSEARAFEFASIFSIEDVHAGMEVPGIVTNLTRFGAFVDIGVKQDGLVHVSEIANRFIKDPAEVLKLNQEVKVKVLEVDIARKRIVLSIRQTQTAAGKPQRNTAAAGRTPGQLEMPQALEALKQKFRK